jgi:hypothetical protein
MSTANCTAPITAAQFAVLIATYPWALGPGPWALNPEPYTLPTTPTPP